VNETTRNGDGIGNGVECHGRDDGVQSMGMGLMFIPCHSLGLTYRSIQVMLPIQVSRDRQASQETAHCHWKSQKVERYSLRKHQKLF